MRARVRRVSQEVLLGGEARADSWGPVKDRVATFSKEKCRPPV